MNNIIIEVLTHFVKQRGQAGGCLSTDIKLLYINFNLRKKIVENCRLL